MRRVAALGYRVAGRLVPLDVTRVLVRPAHATTVARASAAHDPDAGLDFAEADAGMLARRIAADGLDVDDGLLEAVRTGRARCFVALDGERVAGHDFFATGEVPARWNAGGARFRGIGLSLPPGIAYLFKAWVAPPRRGSGVHGALLRHALGALDVAGCRGVVTTADWTNAASLGSFARTGFERRGWALEAVPGGRHVFRVPAPFEVAPGLRVTPRGG